MPQDNKRLEWSPASPIDGQALTVLVNGEAIVGPFEPLSNNVDHYDLDIPPGSEVVYRIYSVRETEHSDPLVGIFYVDVEEIPKPTDASVSDL